MNPEHAVLLWLKLSDDGFGTEEERDQMHQLQDLLGDAIVEKGAGELDGDEFGMGFCTVYLYGPDADKLFAATQPVLKSAVLKKGSYAIKRYGSAEDPDAQEVRVDL